MVVNDCANTVIDFCTSHGIGYHIKKAHRKILSNFKSPACIPADQLEQFLVLLAGRSIIFRRFDVAIPEFFQNVHNITLLKKCV